jgi:hypothetical protein
VNEQSISAMLDLVQTSLLDLEKSRHELNLKSELGTLGGVMIDLNRTDGRCVVIRTASGETVAVAPGEDPAAGEVVIPGNYPHPSLPWWSPDAQEQRRNETIQHLKDAIIWEWDNPYLDPGDWTPLEDEE